MSSTINRVNENSSFTSGVEFSRLIVEEVVPEGISILGVLSCHGVFRLLLSSIALNSLAADGTGRRLPHARDVEHERC